MYLEYYQLREYPFSLTSDPRFLYFSGAHQEAMAALLYALRERKGVSLLVGEPGTGKTTLLSAVLEMLPGGVIARWLDSPLHATPAEAMEAILISFELETAGGLSLRLERLRQFLQASHGDGQCILLVIDEAQDLNPLVLEQVRLLSNLETAGKKLLQIILSGQPELRQHLRLSNGRALHQRIAVHCELPALRAAETAAYLQSRLEHAGARQRLFDDAAMMRIHELAHGVPRVINLVADHCLLAGFAAGAARITRPLVAQVEQRLAGELMPAAPAAAPAAAATPAPLASEPAETAAAASATVQRPPALQRFASGWARWAGLSPRGIK